jgi:hypothetical protein
MLPKGSKNLGISATEIDRYRSDRMYKHEKIDRMVISVQNLGRNFMKFG